MIAYCLALLHQLKADRKGVTALEYGIIAVTMVGVLTVVLPAFFAAVAGLINALAARL